MNTSVPRVGDQTARVILNTTLNSYRITYTIVLPELWQSTIEEGQLVHRRIQETETFEFAFFVVPGYAVVDTATWVLKGQFIPMVAYPYLQHTFATIQISEIPALLWSKN